MRRAVRLAAAWTRALLALAGLAHGRLRFRATLALVDGVARAVFAHKRTRVERRERPRS